MTNVLITYEMVEPTNILLIKIFKLLNEREVLSLRYKDIQNLTVNDIQWSDVVVLVRSTSSFEFRLSKYVHENGKYVILVLDDDFLSLGDDYGADNEGYRPDRKEYLKNILKYTDCILSGNKYLIKKYISYSSTSKYAIINTIVTQDDLKITKSIYINNKIKIVLYVNDGTLIMFNKILRPVIHKFYENDCKNISLYLLGLKPDLSEYMDKLEVHYIPHMPYEKFKQYMRDNKFDIGLAPLDDEGFSVYKYFNKYLEYTAAGIPGIYSDCRLYEQVITNEYNGLLCANNVDSWYNAIKKYITDPSLRESCIKNAQRDLADNFNENIILKNLLKDIPQISSYKAIEVNDKILELKLYYWKLKQYIFRFYGWIYIVISYIKKGKYQSLLKRFYKKFINKKG